MAFRTGVVGAFATHLLLAGFAFAEGRETRVEDEVRDYLLPVVRHLMKYYIDEVPPDSLMRAGVDYLFHALDPGSDFTWSGEGGSWEDNFARLERILHTLDRKAFYSVGADTLVVLDGQALGKPADAARARQMLMNLRGRVHRVITGVAVIDGVSGSARTALCESRVLMRNYSASEIDQYIASGSPFDKAGGYGVQDCTLNPVSHVDGCRANVIGLPLCTMTRLLKESGFNVESLSLPVECRRHLRKKRKKE